MSRKFTANTPVVRRHLYEVGAHELEMPQPEQGRLVHGRLSREHPRTRGAGACRRGRGRDTAHVHGEPCRRPREHREGLRAPGAARADSLRCLPRAGQPSGPSTSARGITRISVERSHQFADGSPWALARTPFPVVTHAAMAETRTIANASN